ncbi:hypothetical protein GEU84_007740 [Fertoebacter nigrum]|uniref:Aspartate carbamoyltransferase catalytic subunit n=1 Tax=Fertoeibacter niger TaxID=2656921 RepID=A0A8X8KMT8_9RHOB|nr:hypothetical protein [Fertoeibacter niger]NUB44270.1 hypothetical protein [Fertoeibacter niger]
MTDALHVPRGERGILRVFVADLTLAEMAHMRDPGPTPGAAFSGDDAPQDSHDPMAALLGLDHLDPDFVELFHSDDIAAIGLAAYLAEGNGVAADQIAADQARLDAVQGPLLIVFSAAFAGQPATLRPDPRLTLIGAYAQETPPVRFEPLPDASARGVTDRPAPRPPMSDARAGGMVATAALLVMFALVALVVWIAG